MADYAVTDYSAITIEAAALEKQIYFMFTTMSSIANQMVESDLFELFPDGVFKDAAGLMHKIEQNEYDLDVVRKFKRTYVIITATQPKDCKPYQGMRRRQVC